MNKKIFVEPLDRDKTDISGIYRYKIIADYIVRDLSLDKSIEVMRIIVDIEKCLFSVYIKMGSPLTPLILSDVSNLIEMSDDTYKIVLKDETVAPEYMRLLWASLGRENVNQKDRYESEIIIKSQSKEDRDKKIDELKNTIVIDPNEKRKFQILEMVDRIIPVGFRVKKITRNIRSQQQDLLVIASENPIFENDVQSIKNKLKESPMQLDEKILDELIQKPKEKGFERFKPWKDRLY
jgi:putative methanogenesis marker protein 17